MQVTSLHNHINDMTYMIKDLASRWSITMVMCVVVETSIRMLGLVFQVGAVTYEPQSMITRYANVVGWMDEGTVGTKLRRIEE